MRYQRFGDRYEIRLENGEPIVGVLTQFANSEAIPFANLGGAGGVQAVRLAFWNPQTHMDEERIFDEQLEVIELQGNMTMKGPTPFFNVHGVFGRRDFSVIGGHVKEAWVHPTFELWIRSESCGIMRRRDEASGLDVLDLPKVLRVPVEVGKPDWVH